MAYIKYGVITKFVLMNNSKETRKYVHSVFNLDLFNKRENNVYYLKNKILFDNLKRFRKELLLFTGGSGDSLNNCEAYCLETDIDTLLNSKLVLTDNNEKYYFSINKHFKFETDQVMMVSNSISLKLYLIPIFWDINRVEFENFFSIANFISILVRNCTDNILKDASFLAVV